MYISFFIVLFCSCVISGLVGFGGNILALPFLSLFLDVKTIVPVLLLTVIFNGAPRLLKGWRNVNLKCFLTMVPLALTGGFTGVYLVNTLHEGWMKLMLSVLMILIATKGLAELSGIWDIKMKEKKNPLLFVFPFMAGMMQAAFACGGPLYNLYIVLNLKQKEQIRTTQYAISITTSVVVFFKYLQDGVYQNEILNFVFLSLPAIILAYFVSEKIFHKMNGSQFLKLVYCVLILAGIMTGWQAIQLF